MKFCDDCKYAEWERTKNGRLHPSRAGRCRAPVATIVLPAAYYWYGSGPPRPGGGYIERKQELSTHCPKYAPRWGC